MSIVKGYFFKVACVIFCYFFVSINLVFLNKYLIGHGRKNDGLTVTISLVQTSVCICLGYLHDLLTKSNVLSFSDLIKYSRSPSIVGLTFTNISMLVLNNLCLRFVDVTFFQLSRSFTLVFTVALTRLFMARSISSVSVSACGLIIFGFVLGSQQEALFGWLTKEGLAFGLLSSLAVAANGIMIAKCMPILDNNAVRLTTLTNISGAVILALLTIFSGEFAAFRLLLETKSSWYWVFLLTSGCFAFGISAISMLQISLTSPVTHHIIVNSKAVIQTVAAAIFISTATANQTSLTSAKNEAWKRPVWWLGNMLVIVGALLYSLDRMRKQRERDKGDGDNDLKSIATKT